MTEPSLRKSHRMIGPLIAVLAILQALTGLFFTVLHLGADKAEAHAGEAASPLLDYLVEAAEGLHLGGGLIGDVYRLVLGTGLLFMACTGLAIWRRIRARAASGKTGGREAA